MFVVVTATSGTVSAETKTCSAIIAGPAALQNPPLGRPKNSSTANRSDAEATLRPHSRTMTSALFCGLWSLPWRA